MDAVDKEFERVVKRQKQLHKATVDSVDGLLQKLTQAQVVVEKASDRAALHAALAMLDKRAQDASTEINSQSKEYYASLTKLSKAVEKKFTQNLELAVQPEAFSGKTSALDEAIALHFVRAGNFPLAEQFGSESSLAIPDNLRIQFHDLYDIRASLRRHRLDAALAWTRTKRTELDERGSHLEFRLHQLQFLALLMMDGKQGGGVKEALAYARKEFAPFGGKHLKEIQRLMTAIIYATSPNTTSPSNLANSPYADLFQPRLWDEVEQQFTREFCSLLGMSQESPLAIAVNVGATAVPTLIKVRSVLDERKKQKPTVEYWSIEDELPVEIPLPKQHRYHSVFACPVSKEQTTDANPAMMLPCGHILGRETVIRISKNKTAAAQQANVAQGQINPAAKVKCPYCPNESTAGQAAKVSF